MVVWMEGWHNLESGWVAVMFGSMFGLLNTRITGQYCALMTRPNESHFAASCQI